MKTVPIRRSGTTLIEITLVISVMLGLLSVFFFGIDAYKQGANRAVCIQNLVRSQKAVRVFCNYEDLIPGQHYPDLKARIIGPRGFLEKEPTCPSSGTYTYYQDKIPPIGTLFLDCSIPEHVPSSTVGW